MPEVPSDWHGTEQQWQEAVHQARSDAPGPRMWRNRVNRPFGEDEVVEIGHFMELLSNVIDDRGPGEWGGKYQWISDLPKPLYDSLEKLAKEFWFRMEGNLDHYEVFEATWPGHGVDEEEFDADSYPG